MPYAGQFGGIDQVTPFQEWLLEQSERNDAVGDLARDYRDNLFHSRPGGELSDNDFFDRVQSVPNSLRMGAGSALEAFKEAYNEWLVRITSH
jgi:hypothetical protein